MRFLAYAGQQARAVLTLNRRHFRRLHRERQSHSGIIACTRDDDLQALAKRIHAALTASNDLSGLLIRINRPPHGTLVESRPVV